MAKESDSVTHTRDRREKMQEEVDLQAQARAITDAKRYEEQNVLNRKMQEEENQLLTKHAGLVHDGETREMLLQRIRDMREDVPKEPGPAKPSLTAYQQEILNAEQQAGREAVARAEKQMEAGRAAQQKAEAETKAREGTMERVHQPNPGQNEQFPTQGAALGKKK